MTHAVGLEASKRGRIRWGLVLARTNAAGASLFAVYVRVIGRGPNCTGCRPPMLWWVIIALAVSAAWFAAWAWSRGRWIAAAAGLFVSLAFPWGYFTMPSAPVVIGLGTVATRRAIERRRSRRPSA